MTEETTLPGRLRDLLNTRAVGKSQAQICRDTGIDRQTLKRLLEDEDWKPRYVTVQKLARYLNTSVEYLLTGQGSKDESPTSDLDDVRQRVDQLERQLNALLKADGEKLRAAIDAAERLSSQSDEGA
jgi:transcriptional regulator with XRE-family HTH domain